MKLLALLIAFAISHFISNPERFRNFAWLHQLKYWVNKNKFFESEDVNMLIILFVPILIIHLLMEVFFDSSLGYFIGSTLILIYCIGPKNIVEQFQVDDLSEENDLPKKSDKDIVYKMSQLSLYRWFGVFFWYVVLGVVGVLLYRFTERLCAEDNNTEGSESYGKLLGILNYPAAWMMALALAIASDFERVYKKCKPFMTLDNLKKMDDSFLYESMDFAVENCEVDADHVGNMEQITINVLKRILIVCLVFVSISVILAI